MINDYKRVERFVILRLSFVSSNYISYAWTRNQPVIAGQNSVSRDVKFTLVQRL